MIKLLIMHHVTWMNSKMNWNLPWNSDYPILRRIPHASSAAPSLQSSTILALAAPWYLQSQYGDGQWWHLGFKLICDSVCKMVVAACKRFNNIQNPIFAKTTTILHLIEIDRFGQWDLLQESYIESRLSDSGWRAFGKDLFFSF